MFITLDHLLWAAPDLDAGSTAFEAMTGVRPTPGGSHPGFGTRNALTSFSEDTYLELLAPDPAQDLSGTWGATVAHLDRPQMFSFALATDDLEGVAAKTAAAGIAMQAPVAMSRKTADGGILEWRIMRMEDPAGTHRLPFFIDWQGAPHPGKTTPGGTTLRDFYALDPDPERLRALYAVIGAQIPVRGAVAHGFVATLETPKGLVVLT